MMTKTATIHDVQLETVRGGKWRASIRFQPPQADGFALEVQPGDLATVTAEVREILEQWGSTHDVDARFNDLVDAWNALLTETTRGNA